MTPSTKTNVTPAERRVLDHFGLEASDLPELDIEELTRQIENPTKIAVCNVINRSGKIVEDAEGPVKVYQEVPVRNYLKELAKKSLRWLRWWD